MDGLNFSNEPNDLDTIHKDKEIIVWMDPKLTSQRSKEAQKDNEHRDRELSRNNETKIIQYRKDRKEIEKDFKDP